MIQMKYKDLLHPRLQVVLGKVANTVMNPKNSYEVNKLLSAVRTELTKIREQSANVLAPFARFENGKPASKVGEDGRPTGEIDFLPGYSEESPEYIQAMEKFENHTAHVGFLPWTLDLVADVKLSAMEIDLLGPLLTDTLPPFIPTVAPIKLHGDTSTEVQQ